MNQILYCEFYDNFCITAARMSMYRPHWMPETQHWSAVPPSTTPVTPTSSRTPPTLSNSGGGQCLTPPPKEIEPTSSSAASTGSQSIRFSQFKVNSRVDSKHVIINFY